MRVINIDGEPWFVARDVAALLGYVNLKDPITTHCKGVVKRYTPLWTAGGMQDVRIIPERDVYRLVMRSKLPAAERFEDWVVGEVLPSIRKTGRYEGAPPQPLRQIEAPLQGVQVLALSARSAANGFSPVLGETPSQDPAKSRPALSTS